MYIDRTIFSGDYSFRLTALASSTTVAPSSADEAVPGNSGLQAIAEGGFGIPDFLLLSRNVRIHLAGLDCRLQRLQADVIASEICDISSRRNSF